MQNQEIAKKLITFVLNNANVVREPRVYANQVTYAFSDKLVDFEDANLFPPMRLHVVRLAPSFVQKNQLLLNRLFMQTKDPTPQSYQDVWLTSSHLTDRGLYLVEYSFE
ncbi:hypothetical protein [Lapidilactobacillus bayanensis]|uniref:hypothetical protein n=1 Tax=Lapidilactobacillus bayanensis TaxID=2485998 RepID=UPI000F77F996|nr:hypothetical protein [Lapidilactobacillus bayanensis]